MQPAPAAGNLRGDSFIFVFIPYIIQYLILCTIVCMSAYMYKSRMCILYMNVQDISNISF